MSSPPLLTAEMPTGIATATRTAATAPAAATRRLMRITSSSLLGGQAPSTQILPSGVIEARVVARDTLCVVFVA